MPQISVSARYRSPRNRFEQSILEAIDRGQLFNERSTIYVPRTRTLSISGTWIIKLDEKGNVEDANIDLFRRNPTAMLSARLRMFGVAVKVKNGRAIFCGRFIDNDPEWIEEAEDGRMATSKPRA